MPNQPKAGTHRHEISAIPDDLWAAIRYVSRMRGQSVSDATRRLYEQDIADYCVTKGLSRSALEEYARSD